MNKKVEGAAGPATTTSDVPVGVTKAAAAEAPQPPASIILPVGKRPGVVSCGPYVPGKVYEVAAVEAERLIAAKGFEIATPANTPAPKE